MRSLIVIIVGLLLVLILGCGTKDGSGKDQTSAAGHPDEFRDSTRLDPAAVRVDSSLLDSADFAPAGPVDTVESPDSPE
ncbi:MAG: hypothetical protein AB1644_03075 [Candidatus Zixiibacteriota bacterium]